LLGKSDAIVLDVVVVVALSLSLFVVVCCVVGVVGCCGVVVVGDDVGAEGGGGKVRRCTAVHRRRCTWHRQARLKKKWRKRWAKRWAPASSSSSEEKPSICYNHEPSKVIISDTEKSDWKNISSRPINATELNLVNKSVPIQENLTTKNLSGKEKKYF
jgi:hypothetical protein